MASAVGAAAAATTTTTEATSKRITVLMVGTGEYTTGYVDGAESKSDKAAGGDMHLCGRDGNKMKSIRAHIERAIGEKYSGSKFDLALTTHPADGKVDDVAYLAAMDAVPKGSVVTIFTPDDTHFEIAMAAVTRGHHVLVTKPAVKTLEHHRILHEAAAKAGVLVAVEVHKRLDPMYEDARCRIQNLGDFSYFTAYMSQPKMQLQTFRSWAGKSSDISYYLNSHHVDYLEWVLGDRARPVQVTSTVATGVAKSAIGVDTEDTITLSVQWQNVESGNLGIALFTSSWAAPPGDVHSQQRFFYMGHKGEITVDQARRGYMVATDAAGYASANPLFMRYTPDESQCFAGQLGYGYRSVESFVRAAVAVRCGEATPESFDNKLATLGTTFCTTAILEAGRRSADDGGRPYKLLFDDSGHRPIAIEPCVFN